MPLNEEGRSGKRPQQGCVTSQKRRYYTTGASVNQNIAESWESIFSRLGLPLPKRGRAQCCLHGGDSNQ